MPERRRIFPAFIQYFRDDVGQGPPGPKRRRAFLAGLFSLLFPGGGQLYNGRPGKALALYLGGYVLLAALALTGLQYVLYGLVALVAVSLAYRVFVVVDAAREARRLGRIEPGPLNRWWVYCLFAVGTVALGSVADPALQERLYRVEMLRIPGQAMAPALVPGDNILADAREATLDALGYGDIVAYEPSGQEGGLHLQRVAGLPGDTVAVEDFGLVRNNERVAEPHAVAPPAGGEGGRDMPLGANTEPWVLGPGQYFLLGDNRVGAMDSRYIGPVARAQLVGKALFIYWSADSGRIGRRLDR